MARVLGVVVLFTLTIIQMDNANANLCKGKNEFDPCGANHFCLCANENVNTYFNNNEIPCNNLVCRDTRCHFFTGKPSRPQMVGGALVACNITEDCGNHFVCISGGYCCLLY